MGLDLSNINIPADDANKLAEIDNTSPAGDEVEKEHEDTQPVENQPTETKENQPPSLGPSEGESQESFDQKPPELEPEKKEANPEEKKDDQPTPPETKEDKPEEKEALQKDAKPEEKVDFHKHPDWMKNEAEKHELEKQLAFEKGKNEALANRDTSTPEKKEEIKSAAQIAEEKVEQKYKDGWEPKDQLELNRVYSEEFEKALEEKDAQKKKEQSEQEAAFRETKAQIEKQMEDIYSEMGVTSEEDKNAVADLANKWIQDGTTTLNINSLRLAAEHLKVQGKIGQKSQEEIKEPKPVVKSETPTPPDQKKDTNSKINRPSNEGGQNTPQKRNISELRRGSMDDIVARNAEALG